jgi:hypothetical protein
LLSKSGINFVTLSLSKDHHDDIFVTLINNLVILSLSKDHHDKPFVTLINNLVTLSLACPELVEGKGVLTACPEFIEGKDGVMEPALSITQSAFQNPR